MAEYLERQKVIDCFEKCLVEYPNNSVISIKRSFEILPAEDVAPVRHGRWEWLGPNRVVTDCMCGTCSACKVRSKYIVNTMVCPNCGAKRDLGVEE